MDTTTTLDRYKGMLLGLAVGDAVGATNEFKSRDECDANPVADMVGGGAHRLRPGEWTDDTSMALIAASALLLPDDGEPTNDRYANMMAGWGRWMRSKPDMRTFFGSAGRGCFDVGNTVRAALLAWDKKVDAFLKEHGINAFTTRPPDPFCGPTDPHTAGNGSIMRLAPFVLYGHAKGLDRAGFDKLTVDSSRLTHGAKEAVDGCRYLGRVLRQMLDDGKGWYKSGDRFAPFVNIFADYAPKISILAHAAKWDVGAATAVRYEPRSKIRSTGYVVDTLKAAIWCFQTTENFRDCVLRAANLGDDADTVGAVAGQLAGAFYGARGIPPGWLAQLYKREMIEEYAERLYNLSGAPVTQ